MDKMTSKELKTIYPKDIVFSSFDNDSIWKPSSTEKKYLAADLFIIYVNRNFGDIKLK